MVKKDDTTRTRFSVAVMKSQEQLQIVEFAKGIGSQVEVIS